MVKPDLIIFVVVAVLFFVATFVSHYFYEEYLWFRSVEDWVPWLQSWSWWPWKGFLRFIYWFGWELLWLIIIAFYSKFNRANGLFAIIKPCEVLWCVSMFKMYWNDPAPYMDRDYIKALECNKNTFMTPSREVTIAAFAYCTMFYLAFDWIDVPRPQVRLNRANPAGGDRENQPLFEDQEPEYFLSDGSRYQAAKADDRKFFWVLAGILFLVFLIGLASMYIGAQSFDQVLFGLCLGIGFFCVIYYFFKDFATWGTIHTSEKLRPNSWQWRAWIGHIIYGVVPIIIARVYYFYQIQDYTVNPRWKSNHYDDCGLLAFPSFFDKEMLQVYNFMYLWLGCLSGLFFDSIFLGGTRIDFNQVRESEDRKPTYSFIMRFVVTLSWCLLTVWGGVELLRLLVHHWLFILAIPYFVCGFGLFSFIPFFQKLLVATRPEIKPVVEVNAVSTVGSAGHPSVQKQLK